MRHIIKRYKQTSKDIGFKILFLAALIGVLSGFASYVFQFFLNTFYQIFITGPQNLLINNGYGPYAFAPFLVSPIIGGILVQYMINHWAKEAKGHGIPEIIEAYHHQDGKIRPRVPLVKILASALTISSGGSAGREGPIAQIGAGLGSLISQKLDLSKKDVKILLISGLAAGISSTFNAPIGAALFTLEIIRPRVSLKQFPIILIASITGYIIRLASIGYELVLDPVYVIYSINLRLLPVYVLLGVVTGIFSGIWIKTFYGIENAYKNFLRKINAPELVKPVISRTIVGLSLCLLYFTLGANWKQYSLIGNTLSPIRYVLSGVSLQGPLRSTLLTLILVLVLKVIVTPLTLASGGSGGVFAPTLFIGAYIGGIFALLIRNFITLSEINVVTIALVGMAGLFAGTCRAPITSIVMTTEMTGNYLIAVPLVITTMIGYIVSRVIEDEDIYSMELKSRGTYVRFYSLDKLKDATVKNNMIKAEKHEKTHSGYTGSLGE
jgi:chloride channel protein, CIC family